MTRSSLSNRCTDVLHLSAGPSPAETESETLEVTQASSKFPGGGLAKCLDRLEVPESRSPVLGVVGGVMVTDTRLP